MKFLHSLFFSFTFCCFANAQPNTGYLTNDGTWCWFSDPRAIALDKFIVTGWVKSDGTIEAAMLDTKSNSIQVSELYYKLEADDHDNPAFVLTGNGEVLAMYTRHSRKDLFVNSLEDFRNDFNFSGAQLIHPFSDEEFQKFPRLTMSYANPVCLEKENNRIYCFGRWTGFKPNMMWSDDDGTTWSKSRVFITNYPFDSNNRPYVKYFSDGKSKIHIVFTDGHPRDEPTNSVYYACFENGAFYKASGEQICTMEQIPFEPKDATIVFTSNPSDGRAWIADIGQDEQKHPVILYTRSPTENNHEYWYARYTDSGWSDNKICDSGKWFPQTPEGKKEPEPHYFGGMTIHPGNADVVYLSRQVNGVFEIERRETKDSGNSWKIEEITKNSQYDNVRPYIPRGLKAGDNEVVLWMENQKYIHYTNFKTSIKYFVRY
ncbi:MAG: BNR-4 repeat-containing protein [Prolixibacteraceae bacterium]|nr:BNR-4 repeat-containing protein [Prolixibacteraceae bacterium]